MKLLARLQSWLETILHRSTFESRMESEMRFHMDEMLDGLVRKGVPPEEARRQLALEFGSVQSSKEDCRSAVGLQLLDNLRDDLRYGLRNLRQAPGFATIAIVSLALGIGANTAVFSILEAAIWKTVPAKNPRQLRLLSWVSGPKIGIESSWGDWEQNSNETRSSVFAYPVYQQLKRENRTLENLFAFKNVERITAVVDAQPELVGCHLVSGDFFVGVGVSPLAGRPIVPADDQRTSRAVGVISYGYWQRRFARDASAIGKEIRLNQVPVTIIGVMPPEFSGLEQGHNPDVYLPLTLQPLIVPNQYAKNSSLIDDSDVWWLQLMGRLKPGISEAQAQVQLDVVLRQATRAILPKSPELPQMRLVGGSHGVGEVRDTYGKPLFIIGTLVALVLLIACANVANLLLARATTRQREVALRLALGAGKSRVVRQMLTEGLLLAFLGGGFGIVLGYLIRNVIPGFITKSWQPTGLEIRFNYPVLAICLGVTILTGILFSLAPVWQSLRVDLNGALKEGGRSTMTLPKLMTAKSLVVFQIALCLMLLVGAGLFVRTLSNLKSASLGFRPERILLFTVNPPRTLYAGERRKTLYEELEQQVAAIPGVQSSTLSAEPVVGGVSSTTSAAPEGRSQRPGMEDQTWVNDVGNRFFDTMGIPILYGRSIDSRDRANAPKVAVVNQQFVHKFFPRANALGQTIRNGDQPYRIIGICGDARYRNIQQNFPPTFYRSFKQVKDLGEMTFEIKTAASPASTMRIVRERVASVDKDLPLFDIRSQEQQIAQTLWRERLFVTLTSAFGILALVLASVGIYGVMSYGVARRTSEIGIRMALGAHSTKILGMILREAVILAVIGLVLGGCIALALSRYLGSMLYGLKASDPLTFAGAILLLFAITLLSGWWPARKASRLAPMIALRSE